MSKAKLNFILQQGLSEPSYEQCPLTYSSLQFQPRVVGFLFLWGVIFQHPAWFFFMSGILWVSALFPRLNPFEAIYNRIVVRNDPHRRLGNAAAPRRFSQGMAATFCLCIAISQSLGWVGVSWALQVLMASALLALIVAKFCLGSFIYYLLSGQVAFAKNTLPWK